MAIPYHRIEPFLRQVFDYCTQRINELEHEIDEAQRQLTFFKKFKGSQKRCMACYGRGRINVYYDIDNRVVEICQKCLGTGEEEKL